MRLKLYRWAAPNPCMHMPELRISLEPDAPQSDRRQVIEGLLAFNAGYASLKNAPSISVFLRDADSSIRGGLLGEVLWGWLHVNSLWVGEPYRHQGLGSQMLQVAEQEAKRLGCHSAHLDTFGFQARPFYERHGYQVFGELPDYPEGFTRYYMAKRLIDTRST